MAMGAQPQTTEVRAQTTEVRTRTPRSSAKHEAILDAARSVFLEMGYAAASMDAVAARAGASKATIYAHFRGKDVLFAAVISRRCEEIFILDAPEESEDARATLTAIAQRLMGVLLSPDALGIFRVVVAESPRQPDLVRAFYEAGPAAGKAAIAAMLAELDRKGKLVIPDPIVAADLFVGMLRSDVFMRALLGLPPAPPRTPEATIASAVETMMRAFGVIGG
jgi:TetR/AcrR family transcriptional repressor of mexJK operon